MDGQQVFTINQFCVAYAVSRAKLYQLFNLGEGPATFRVGARVLISRAAADEWVKKLEQQNQQSPSDAKSKKPDLLSDQQAPKKTARNGRHARAH